MVDGTVFEMWLGPLHNSNDRFDPSNVNGGDKVGQAVLYYKPLNGWLPFSSPRKQSSSLVLWIVVALQE